MEDHFVQQRAVGKRPERCHGTREGSNVVGRCGKDLTVGHKCHLIASACRSHVEDYVVGPSRTCVRSYGQSMVSAGGAWVADEIDVVQPGENRVGARVAEGDGERSVGVDHANDGRGRGWGGGVGDVRGGAPKVVYPVPHARRGASSRRKRTHVSVISSPGSRSTWLRWGIWSRM